MTIMNTARGILHGHALTRFYHIRNRLLGTREKVMKRRHLFLKDVNYAVEYELEVVSPMLRVRELQSMGENIRTSY